MAFAGELEENGYHSILFFFCYTKNQITSQKEAENDEKEFNKLKENIIEINWLTKLKNCFNEKRMENSDEKEGKVCKKFFLTLRLSKFFKLIF